MNTPLDPCSICREDFIEANIPDYGDKIQFSTEGSIILPDGRSIKTSCDHAFHSKCITNWINTVSTASCPLCRREITIIGLVHS